MKKAVGLFIFLSFVLFGNAFAADQKPTTLPEVVVSATRSEIAVTDAPASVSVVSEEQIEQKNTYRIADAIAQVPNLYFRGSPFGGDTPGSGQGGFTMRGISARRALIMVDGHTINSGYSTGVDWSSISLDDVERIEVVPGAFSSLYGGNAMGGLVNVITKEPTKREFTAHADYGFGFMEDYGGGMVYRDKLPNGVGLSMSLNYKDNESYSNDQVVKTATTGTGGTAVTGATPTQTAAGLPAYIIGDKGTRPWDQWNASVKTYLDFGGDTKANIGYAYDEYYAWYTPFTTSLHDAAGNPISSGTVHFSDNGNKQFSVNQSDFLTFTPTEEETHRIFGELTHDFDNGSQMQISSMYNIYGNYYTNPVSGVSTYEGGRGTLTDTPNDRFETTLQYKFLLGKIQEWVTGLAYNRNSFHRRNSDLTYWRDPYTKTNAFYEASGHNETYGLFAQDKVNVTDQVTLYGGGRFDYWLSEGSTSQTATPLQPSLVGFDHDNGTRSESQFSPKGSLVYKPWDNVSFHGSVGKAFRTPTLLDLYADGVTTKTGPVGIRTTQADPNLKPETLISSEIGTDITFPTETKVTLTFFQNDLYNLIYQKSVISGTTSDLNQLINAGRARIRGIEATVDQPLPHHFDLMGSFTFNNSDLLRNDAAPATVGRHLTEVPEYLGSLGLNWQYKRYSAYVEGRYSGHVFGPGDDVNANKVDGVFGTYDQYFIMNVKFGYQINENFKANFAIDNLLDQKYYQYYLQPGTEYTVSLTAKF